MDESYHGQLLEVDEKPDEDATNLENWHVGKLKFKKHIDDAYRNSVDDYVVIDPREMSSSSSSFSK